MSFRAKTILGVALIEAAFLFILVVSSLQSLASSNAEALAARARTTAALFARTIRSAVLVGDNAFVRDALRDILHSSGVVYARVRDAEGRVLAEGGRLDALTAPAQQMKAGMIDASAEVTSAGRPYARVELGLATDPIQAVVADARGKTIAIAVAELILVGLFSYVLGTYLTRTLAAMKVATQRIASGEAGYQVAVSGHDELAETGRAFNEMSRHLKMVYRERMRVEAELMALNEELESRVEQRTEELAQAYRKIERQALYDSLTGLPNRTLLQARLEEEIGEAQKTGRGFALAILDFNGFKEINDTLGHHAGDLALQRMASRLESAFSRTATVARLGGDEFALLLPRAETAEAATRALDKVAEAFSRPVRLDGQSAQVGASVGVARYPDDGTDPELLMRRADTAMYHAKRRKLDCVVYASRLERRARAR